MTGLHDYGALLLASRLRRVSEALYAGVDATYQEHGVGLPARCFPILFLLRDRGRMGISELAVHLGQSHAAVSQMSRKLLKHAVVREWPDPLDDRRRLLALSRRGAHLMARLKPVWHGIVEAVGELEATHPLSTALTGIDQALETRNFATRIRARLQTDVPLEIIPFEPRYAPQFKRLNLEWLAKYFHVEPVDERVLSRPREIVAGGGAILLARRRREIVGTCALLHAGNQRFELTKMAVTARYQGLGIGRKLLAAAIAEFAARAGAELYLESNSVLRPAIALYESVGFVHTPRPTPSAYERSDVYMVYRAEQLPGRPVPHTEPR